MRQNLGPIQTVFMNTELEGAPHTWTLEALFPKKLPRPEASWRSGSAAPPT